MRISDVKSIELDRSVPFKHCIRLKNGIGETLELIPISETGGWEKFIEVTKAWENHPDFNPKVKK